MVYYIRFLKLLKVHSKEGKDSETIKALVTITTDLGDGFYPADLQLVATLVPADSEDESDGISSTKGFWRAGMRSFWIELPIMRIKMLMSPLRLCVSYSEDQTPQELDSTRMPKIVGVWSDILVSHQSKHTLRSVERRFLLDKGLPLSIWEDAGESIAKHIWDAGLVMVSYFHSIFKQSPKNPIYILSKHFKDTNVLELGSGCGIVGIAFTQMVPHCNVLLTDLPAALNLLHDNISKARLASGSKVTADTLDWDDVLPEKVTAQAYDLILLSDCTYNVDSLPALVRTLKSLISFSPAAHIIISMKVRHPSEVVFFDLMLKEAMTITEHTRITLPDDHRSTIDVELEFVDIYTFRHQNALLPL